MVKAKYTFFQIIVLIFILALHNVGFSQTNTYTVPVNWVNYSVKNKNATFQMPKLPIVIEGGNKCNGEETVTYGTYADGVAYVVRITSKVKPLSYCPTKRNFDEKNFTERVQSLKKELKIVEDSKSDESGSKEIKLVGKEQIYNLINDYKNRRWFEFNVVGGDENKSEVKNFLTSLKIEKKTTGIEIGNGADRTLGDETETKIGDKTTTDESGSGNLNTTPLRIVLKPRASFTDCARQSQLQGTVVLKVTFLASGGIGSIAVVRGLPCGLTEQTIAAASKIVFIPAQGKGKRVSVTKTVEYSFTIY